MTTVHVVMGNDFPCGVAKTKALAEALIKQMKLDDKRRGFSSLIHYRIYPFDLVETKEALA